MNIIRLIKNMIKIAKLLSVDDSGDFQFLTVSMLGKEQRVLSLKPYGLMSNPPTSSMVTVFSQQGQESNGLGIADDPKNRILTDMAEGVVGLGNYITASYITFDENGDAILATTHDAIIGSSNNITLFSSNNVVLVAVGGKITATAPVIELNGNGDNLVTWAALSSLLASYWAIYNGHSHAGAGLIDSTVSFNILSAKADTLKTDG
jgi:phage gp45-like